MTLLSAVLGLPTCLNVCGPQAGSFTWDLARKAESLAPPLICWGRTCLLPRCPGTDIYTFEWHSVQGPPHTHVTQEAFPVLDSPSTPDVPPPQRQTGLQSLPLRGTRHCSDGFTVCPPSPATRPCAHRRQESRLAPLCIPKLSAVPGPWGACCPTAVKICRLSQETALGLL